jgi:DNA-binding CsgD family transcriptional regulator
VSQWDFVGRNADLSRLVSVAGDPDGGGLVLSGEPGIGKSRLLREAVRGLPEQRYAVFHAAANVAGAGLPFGGLAQILPPDPPAGPSPAGLLQWATDAVRARAGGRPIVLAVDDAHLLDAPSASLTHLLVRQGATLLATVRTGEPVPGPIAALWTEGLVGHADLAPLSTGESRDLLVTMLGGPVDASSARRLAELAAGNPLLLRELVLAARAGGEMHRSYGVWRWTGRLTLAPSLADLVDTRIGNLTPGVRDVLELAAFGEPLGLPLLLRAADPADVETAEERGLIRVTDDGKRRDVRLAHPLYGEVVRRHGAVTRSRRLLARLADLVEEAGARRRDDLLRVAVWRLDSGTAQDGSLLLDAAVQAFGRYDLDLARRLAHAAGEAGAGYDATELLATALLSADRPQDAIAVLDRAPDGPPSRRATTRATVSFWGLGRPGAPDELAAARTGDPAAQARMRAVEASMRLQLKQLAPARELADGVLADLAQTGGFGFGSAWASLLQAQAAWLRGRTAAALAATEHACAALAAHRLYDRNAHAARAHTAALCGEVTLAVESMAAAESATDLCDALFYPWRTHAKVWTLACTGDVPGAVRLNQDLIVRLRADGFAGHEVIALHDLVRLGRPGQAAGRMRALLATAPGGRAAALLMRHAAAAAAGSGDELLAVARDFQAHGYLLFAAEAAAGAVRVFRAARDPQALAASTLLGDVLARCDTVRTPALLAVQPSLTGRERQVAQLAAGGAKSREIADQLFLSPRTVENHLQRVYAKLGVNGRNALAPALRSLPQ